MHNIWVRLNAVIFFALTVLLVLATLCAFSTFFHTAKPVIKVLKVHTLRSLRNTQGVDRALMSLNITADLRPAFHWNIKQLFVFVVAEYASEANPLNQVIIWDKIVKSKEEAELHEVDAFVKYALVDQGAELRNKTISLRLMWDHMPITGRLYNGDDKDPEKSTFVLPDEIPYPSERKKKELGGGGTTNGGGAGKSRSSKKG